MKLRNRDGLDGFTFFLDILALAETSRRMARVSIALAIESGNTDSTPANAALIRRTVTTEIPNLLAEAERAGIPTCDLSAAAIEAWPSRMFRVDETRAVLDGP